MDKDNLKSDNIYMLFYLETEDTALIIGIAVSSVLVAIALLACMVVLVVRYRKKEEELEVQEERLTEVILENRDLKAARDSDDEGYYQFEEEGGRCHKSGSINTKIFLFADSVRSHINTSMDDSKDGQTGADEKWFEDGEATSEEAEAAIKIKWSSQSSTHVKVVETDDVYSVIVDK